jgi:hypothetical protein
MGDILCSAILTKAGKQLQDTGAVRWTQTTLFDYLKDGQREIAALKPDACTVTGNVTLVAGSKQTLPDGATGLVRPVRNMGADGITPGRSIEMFDMTTLQTLFPEWSAMTGDGEVLFVGYDKEDPVTFFTVPPQPDISHKIESVYGVLPADPASVDSVITVRDVYANALLDYVLYRAYGEETEAGSASKSAAHYQAMAQVLGIRMATQTKG